MLIRCTARILKEIGIAKVDLVEEQSCDSLLGDWYANLFYAVHRECVIFINSRTLFSFLSFGVRREDIRNLGNLFRIELGRAMLDEDFEGALIQRLISDYQGVRFAKTQDKRVLGVMVDQVKNIKFMLEDKGVGNLSQIIKLTNRTPVLAFSFVYPISEFKRLLGVKDYDNIEIPVPFSEDSPGKPAF